MDESDECLCRFCRTFKPAVAFERLPVEVWPEGRDACGDCADAMAEEREADRRYDAVHAGACACRDCV